MMCALLAWQSLQEPLTSPCESGETISVVGLINMVKKMEKWLLVIVDKDFDPSVYRTLKPALTKTVKNENATVTASMFYGAAEEIDELYGKLKSANREQELVSLFVGEMWEKDMPGGLNEILKTVFGDKGNGETSNQTSSAQNP